MAFLNPWLLLGVLGVGVPIAVHLFNRFRPKTVEWAAMELLRRALATRSRQVKMEDLVLLILRCLAVLLLALALARPTLIGSAAGWLGGSPRASVVLAIDGSYSMDHHPGITTRFDAARQRARDALASVATGSPLTLTLLGREPQTLLRSTGYDRQIVEPILKDAAPLPEPMALEPSLAALEQLARELPGPARELYLITDAQASTWQNLSPAAHAKLQQLNNMGGVLIIPVEAQRHENLGLTSFELASGAARQGATARYVARVRNFGTAPQRDVKVRLVQDGQPVDQRVIDEVPAGETADVSLMARFETAGVVRLTAELGPDALAADNVRHAVANVRSSVRVLLVDGAPGSRPFEGEAEFLAAALAPRAGAGRLGIDVQTIDWLGLPSAVLAGFDVVVLANVTDVPAESAEALRRFVEAGGGLTVFLGDRTAARIYNARFGGDRPLLPAELGEALGDPESADAGWSIEVTATDHPVTRVLASLPAALVSQAQVLRRVELAPRPGATVLLSVADQRPQPLAVAGRYGRGSVVVIGTTANRAWTNLPVHPVFPILAHQVVGYQTRSTWETPRLVGDDLRVSLPTTSLNASVVFTPPAGEAVSVRAGDVDGQVVAELVDAPLPGFFEVAVAGQPPVAVAVNVDPSESNAAALPVSDLRQLVDGTGARVLSPGDDVASAVRESRVGRELWKPLMVLALVLFAVEAFLARRFTARAHQKVTLATATHREQIADVEPPRREAA